jgi:separase
MFLKDYVASNPNQSVSNHAFWSSLFLSMANDITTRRESLNCLKIKTLRSLPSNLTSDSAWPATEEDDPVAKYAVVDRNPKWLQAHFNALYTLYRKEPELDYSEFKGQFVDILPEHWTVCSLTIDPTTQDIYAVQLRRNESPFVVKLPINRAQLRSQQYPVAISYEEAQAELKDIINGSDETINVSKSCTSTSQVTEWWDTRIKLDNRLKTLLENMESQWFSGFKGLMAGRFHEHKEELVKFQKGLSDTVYKFVNQISTTKKPIEFNLAFCRLAFKLGRRPNPRDLEDLAYYTLTCYVNQGIELDYSKMNTKQVSGRMISNENV